jgi:hypothetical protein
MPATDAHAMPSIAAHWIKNNVLAAIIFRIAELAIYGVGEAIGAENEGPNAAAALFLVDIASWALAGIAYGVLSGAVLQRIVPNLPARAWIALQALLAAITAVDSRSGFTAALATLPVIGDDRGLFEAVVLFLAALIGAILGALAGGAEALVLRRAASGTLVWIGCASVSQAMTMVLVTGTARLWERGPSFTDVLMGQTATFLVALIGAVVMLPALRRLKDPLLSKAGSHFD